jgi:cold shock CspA family protein
MQVPLETSFRGLSDAEVDAAHSVIKDRVAKIDRLARDAISCRIAVSRPQEHQDTGSSYRACLRVTLSPHKELVVAKEPGDNDLHSDVRAVLNDAFDALQRQVVSTIQKRREHHHPAAPEPTGFVVRLFRDSRYGFIKTPDGEELYFHANAVTRGEFDRIEIGTQVRVVATDGEEGPQASTVDIVDKPGARREPGGAVEAFVPPSWKPRPPPAK